MARQRHERLRMESLLARRERRGLTWAELSAECGVPITTLSWWSGKLRRERQRSAAAKAGFVELVPAPASPPADDARVEIGLRSGRQLVVREAIAPSTLTALVAALEA